MSEIHWEPTAHLRFVEKDEYERGDIRTLQQKWIGKELGMSFHEEWRDVPLEVEDE